MDRLGKQWMDAMRRGDFGIAWKISDRILVRGAANPDVPHWQRPVWDGRSFGGKRVLITCLHGLGDTIQFVRYTPLVRQIARAVIIAAQPELVPLLKTMRGGFDEIVTLDQIEFIGHYDIAAEVMELPYVFRSTVTDLPNSVPYFFVEPKRDRTNSEDLKVGLVWQSGNWDDRRSVPFDSVRLLGDVPNVQWCILQRGAGLIDWHYCFGIDSGSDDVLEAARVIAGLDVLISVDSMPAHLGGALGVPTWTLLHAGCDWRWMQKREDSPWYPTMRLFRQRKSGDWAPVMARMKRELTALVDKVTARTTSTLSLVGS